MVFIYRVIVAIIGTCLCFLIFIIVEHTRG